MTISYFLNAYLTMYK